MFLRALILLFLWLSTKVEQRNLHERWEGQLQRYIAPTGVVKYSDWKKEAHS